MLTGFWLPHYFSVFPSQTITGFMKKWREWDIV